MKIYCWFDTSFVINLITMNEELFKKFIDFYSNDSYEIIISSIVIDELKRNKKKIFSKNSEYLNLDREKKAITSLTDSMKKIIVHSWHYDTGISEISFRGLVMSLEDCVRIWSEKNDVQLDENQKSNQKNYYEFLKFVNDCVLEISDSQKVNYFIKAQARLELNIPPGYI